MPVGRRQLPTELGRNRCAGTEGLSCLQKGLESIPSRKDLARAPGKDAGSQPLLPPPSVLCAAQRQQVKVSKVSRWPYPSGGARTARRRWQWLRPGLMPSGGPGRRCPREASSPAAQRLPGGHLGGRNQRCCSPSAPPGRRQTSVQVRGRERARGTSASKPSGPAGALPPPPLHFTSYWDNFTQPIQAACCNPISKSQHSGEKRSRRSATKQEASRSQTWKRAGSAG